MVETVTVALKSPMDLICRVMRPAGKMKNPVEGLPDIQHWAVETEFRLRGSHQQRALESAGVAVAAHPMVVNGYGITEGVDKALFEKWLGQSKETKLVTSGAVFAMPDLMGARSRAADSNPESGLEPLKPKAGDRVEPSDAPEHRSQAA
jgi:hypothetical protein